MSLNKRFEKQFRRLTNQVGYFDLIMVEGDQNKKNVNINVPFAGNRLPLAKTIGSIVL